MDFVVKKIFKNNTEHNPIVSTRAHLLFVTKPMPFIMPATEYSKLNHGKYCCGNWIMIINMLVIPKSSQSQPAILNFFLCVINSMEPISLIVRVTTEETMDLVIRRPHYT